ncbi:hypothetical protein SESBI_14354 [Sesbania bispinosa]|nr:hypothetical protein SESBI_14354 [Sesbania bispinosa]
MALVPVGFHTINKVCGRRENWGLIVKLVRVWNMCSIATPNSHMPLRWSSLMKRSCIVLEMEFLYIFYMFFAPFPTRFNHSGYNLETSYEQVCKCSGGGRSVQAD